MPDKYIIRTSDRGLFKQCRQKWEFTSKIRQDWEPNKDAEPLVFGTAIHAGLEAYYDPDLWEESDRLIVESHVLGQFTASLPKLPQDASDEDAERHAELLALGRGMLQHYFRYAPTVDRFKPLYTEIEFEVPVTVDEPDGSDDSLFAAKGGCLYRYDDEEGAYKPVVYQGRIDLIVEDEWGAYFLADHKTAGKFSPIDWLELDDQCGSYGWAVAKQLGVKVNGIIYNELRKDVPHPPNELKSGGLSKDKRQNTTYELYVEELTRRGLSSDGYHDILEHFKSEGNKFFRRTVVRRSEREFELLGGRIALESLDMLDNPRIYPNPTQFNCNGCQFYAPCLATQDGSDPQYILDANFRKRD